MGKRIKFSLLKARMLLMLYPMTGLAGLILILSLMICFFRFAIVELVFGFNYRFDHLFVIVYLRVMFIFKLIGILQRIVQVHLLLNSNIEELRYCYTELEQDWENLNYADYLDDRLPVLIYGDHLICYRTFDIVYLPECRKISASMKTLERTSSCRYRRVNLVHFFASDVDGRKTELRTNNLQNFWGVDQEAHKYALFDYITANYDYIEVQTTS